MQEADKKELARVGFLDLYVSFVALYSVVLLLVSSFVTLTAEQQKMFDWADLALCALFLFDLGLRWHQAEDKLRFWRWAWVDLLASVPMLPFLRWGRSLRLLRIIQMLRAVEGVRMLQVHIFKGRRVSAPVLAFFIFYTIMMVCAPAILMAESGGAPGATILTAGDAIWWVFETISTVGYGDYAPVTTLGRVVGVMTMVFGIGMFGAITATVLSLFGLNTDAVAPAHKPDDLHELRLENERLKSLVAGGAGKPADDAKAGNDCNLA